MAEIPDGVAASVKKQVEFYFSDSNMPRDKFLLEIVNDEKNPEHWVELKTIVSFSRMRSILKEFNIKPDNVPQDAIAAVAEVMKGSDTVVVSEDGSKIRRKDPLGSVEDAIKAADDRSLYVTPFPYNATLEALTKFFEKEAPVNCVRMRRFLNTKDFRGSIFVEFDSVESAAKVAEKDLEYAGAPLRMLPKSAFKEEVIEMRQAKAQATAAKGGAAQEVEEAPPVEVHEKGLIVHFKFKDEADGEMTREIVHEAVGGESKVEFVKYCRGQQEGHLRYVSADAAKEAMEALGETKEMQIGGKATAMVLLEGEEEDAYWEAAAQAKAEYRQRKFDDKRRRGGHGGGGRGKRKFGGGYGGHNKSART